MSEFSRMVKVSKKELEEAAKSPEAAALLTQKYRENIKDPVKTSLFLDQKTKDLQEKLKNLKVKAEAIPWTPSEPRRLKYTPRDEFNGTIGKYAKSGVDPGLTEMKRKKK